MTSKTLDFISPERSCFWGLLSNRVRPLLASVRRRLQPSRDDGEWRNPRLKRNLIKMSKCRKTKYRNIGQNYFCFGRMATGRNGFILFVQWLNCNYFDQFELFIWTLNKNLNIPEGQEQNMRISRSIITCWNFSRFSSISWSVSRTWTWTWSWRLLLSGGLLFQPLSLKKILFPLWKK